MKTDTVKARKITDGRVEIKEISKRLRISVWYSIMTKHNDLA